jgi:hypothetical protein
LKITTRRHQIINGKTIRIYHKTNTEKQKGELCAEKGLYGVDNGYLKVKLWQFIKKFTTLSVNKTSDVVIFKIVVCIFIGIGTGIMFYQDWYRDNVLSGLVQG